MCKNNDIFKLISSDEHFLQYICTPKNLVKYEIKTIPRKSFTGFRLTYATPWEISQASKTLLLGGIPKYWYQEQQSHFWKFFTRCYTKKVKERMNKLTLHGHKRIYNKNIYAIIKGNSKFNARKKDKIPKIKLLKNVVNRNELVNFDFNQHISSYSTEKKDPQGWGFTVSCSKKLFRRHSTATSIAAYSRLNKTSGNIKRSNSEKLSTRALNEKSNDLKDHFKDNYMINWLDIKYSEIRKRKRRYKQSYNKRRSKYSNINKLNHFIKNNIENKYKLLKLLKPIGEENLEEFLKLNNSLPEINNLKSIENKHTITMSNNNGVNQLIFNNKKYITPQKYPCHKLLSSDLLIMQKIGLMNKSPNKTFNENENIDTRIEERWCEYFAILTETSDVGYPLIIKCYKKENYKFAGDIPQSCKPILIISLNSSSIISFYSLLDKTVVIQNAMFIHSHTGGKSLIKHIEIFILQCKLVSTSFQWFNTLNQYFKKLSMTRTITVKIPEIKLALNIKINLVIFRFLEMIEKQERNIVKLAFLEGGLYVFPCALVRYFYIIILRKLTIQTKIKQFQNLSNLYSNAGCNLKINNRIELYPSNDSAFLKNYFALFNSHQLEYRNWSHSLCYYEGGKVNITDEPTPIEGFLLKINCDKDIYFNMFKKEKFKLYYIFTSDNLLFCTSSYKCSPLLPRDIKTDKMGSILNIASQRGKLDKIPLVYKEMPYDLDRNGLFKWLTPSFKNEQFKNNDYFAFKCYNTKLLRILKSDGIINMNDIENVTYATDVDPTTLKTLAAAYHTFWKKESNAFCLKHCLLKIIMKNHKIIYLMGPTLQVTKIWIVSLNNMMKYWNYENFINSQKLRELQTQDSKQTNSIEMHKCATSSLLTEHTLNKKKFDINDISLLRPIIQKGILFQKVRKHSSFHKYFVILIPGFIMLFSLTYSSKRNLLYQYEHYQTISIENCYAYSGTACSSDLINDDFTFDSANPGYHTTPKLFEDGWNSEEESNSRCFSIYFGRKNSTKNKYIRNHKDVGYNDNKEDLDICYSIMNKNHIKMQFQFKIMTFMAKSRNHRDIWLLALQQELERLNRHG
ncbi:Spo71p PWA37_001908 [Arxiozyma heterogenica]|uniref:Spo71p n=1 Tax=Arxiozyma heterogenica TaxID=278026 RepID=UPI002F01DE01